MALTRIEESGPSGYVALPRDVLNDDRTGEPPVSNELLALDGSLPVHQPQLHLLNAALRSSLASALGGLPNPAQTITSYGTVYVVDASTWFEAASEPFEPTVVVVKPQLRVLPRAVPQKPPLVEQADTGPSAPLTPAEELRALTGLAPGMLADVFGVSRTTFYNWIEGATPRDERFQHLVDTLTHVKDAHRRLPPTMELGSWLRTPIAPGAKMPLDYLRDRAFTVFRGLVLRASPKAMGLSSPLTLPLGARTGNRDQRAAARERLSPPPRVDEDEG